MLHNYVPELHDLRHADVRPGQDNSVERRAESVARIERRAESVERRAESVERRAESVERRA